MGELISSVADSLFPFFASPVTATDPCDVSSSRSLDKNLSPQLTARAILAWAFICATSISIMVIKHTTISIVAHNVEAAEFIRGKAIDLCNTFSPGLAELIVMPVLSNSTQHTVFLGPHGYGENGIGADYLEKVTKPLCKWMDDNYHVHTYEYAVVTFGGDIAGMALVRDHDKL